MEKPKLSGSEFTLKEIARIGLMIGAAGLICFGGFCCYYGDRFFSWSRSWISELFKIGESDTFQ